MFLTLFHSLVVHEDVSLKLIWGTASGDFGSSPAHLCGSLHVLFVCVNVLIGKGETELIHLADDRNPRRVRVQAVITVATMCGNSRLSLVIICAC